MDPSFLSLLRCSVCHSDPLEHSSGEVRCKSCGASFERTLGYYDFLDTSKGEPTPATAEQRLMESELVARLYERFWRPAFVRVMAGKGASGPAGGISGELFIHKHALGIEDRKGPVLDLSCGPGTFTRAIAASAPGIRVVGLDISRAMLEVASQRVSGYGNVALVRADAHELPFRSGSMSAVNNTGALHVYNDPERVFAEIIRVLEPGGIYVGSTFAKASARMRNLAARVAGIRRFDPSELRAWLSRMGFADFEEIQLGAGLIFRARKP